MYKPVCFQIAWRARAKIQKLLIYDGLVEKK